MENAQAQVTNPMPGSAFVIGSMALGAILAPVLVPVAGGFTIAHLVIARRRQRRSPYGL